MKQRIESYETLIFDCDGVVLDSNRSKTEAFYRAALPYGEDAAKAMVEYHLANGGISRYKKFDWFLAHMGSGQNELELEGLLDAYRAHVRKGLFGCAIASGLEEFRQRTPYSRWLIVSGGSQDELREVFARRGISKLFDGGVFGSPDTKEEIVTRELSSGNIKRPTLFLGDSKYDHETAHMMGLDFVFISNWSEMPDWRQWVGEKGLSQAGSVSDLIPR